MPAPHEFLIKFFTSADTSGAQETARALGQVRKEATEAGVKTIALGAALGTAAKDAAKDAVVAFRNEMRATIELADRLEDSLGRFQGLVSGEALQQLGNAASLNGSSLEGVTQAMGFLIRTSQNAIGGNEELQASFSRLGLTLADLKDLTPDEVFLRIADAVKEARDPAAAYAAVIDVMGRSAGSLVSTLSMGSAAIRKSGQEMGYWSDETRRSLAAAQDEIDRLRNKFTIFAGETTANVLTSFRALAQAPAPTIAKLLTLWDATGLSGPFVEAVARATNQIDGLRAAAGPASTEVRRVGEAAENLPDKELELKRQLELTTQAADNAKAAVDRLQAASNNLQSIKDQIAAAKDAAAKAEIDRQVDAGKITRESGARQKLAIDINARDRADTAAVEGVDSQIAEAEARRQTALAKKAQAEKRFATTLKLDEEGKSALAELDAVTREIEVLKSTRAALTNKQTIERTAAVDAGLNNVSKAAAQDATAQPNPAPASPAAQIASATAPLAGRGTATAEAARNLNQASRALLDGATPEEAANYQSAVQNFMQFARVNSETMATIKAANDALQTQMQQLTAQVQALGRK